MWNCPVSLGTEGVGASSTESGGAEKVDSYGKANDQVFYRYTICEGVVRIFIFKVESELMILGPGPSGASLKKVMGEQRMKAHKGRKGGGINSQLANDGGS